jgi:CheY-like chemotaxis protein
VQIAQQLRPSLMLIDIMMPGISGEDIVAELQNNPNTRSIPYIFLTGIVTEGEVRDEAETIAGHHFVAKPVEIKALIPLMNRLIKYSNIPE